MVVYSYNKIQIYLRGNLWHKFKLLKVKSLMDVEDEVYYNFYLLEYGDIKQYHIGLDSPSLLGQNWSF